MTDLLPIDSSFPQLLVATGIAGILLAAAWAIWIVGTKDAWRAWTFLARFHFDGGFTGYRKTFRLLREARSYARSPVTAFEAALLQTEIDILKPEDEKPRRFGPRARPDMAGGVQGYTEISFAGDLTRYGAAEEKRLTARDDLFRKLVDWKAEERRAEARTKASKRTRAATDAIIERPVIEIDNPAVIDSARQTIARYFIAGKSLGETFPDEFQSFVKLQDGFFAPLFLIAGLMTRFDQDWNGIIKGYGMLLTGSTNLASRELVELQSFEFNCWLLWGPSIPACHCECWQTKAGRSNPEHDSMFYQYGFGDENNSIDVLVEGGRSTDFRKKIAPLFKQPFAPGADRSDDAPRVVAAFPTWLLGKINYGPALDENHCCQAQNAVRDPTGGRIYLALDRHEIGALKPGERKPVTDPGSQYYSAYLWIMFVVCKSDGTPLHAGEKQEWRNLLPFFEHGNIADATTMQTLKEGLAIKALNALKEVLSRPSDRARGLIIRYACAFDHSNCTDPEGMLFPHGPQTAQQEGAPLFRTGRRDHDDVRHVRPTRIADLFETMARWDLMLSREIADGRLILPSAGGDWAFRDDYSACHLPDAIETFKP